MLDESFINLLNTTISKKNIKDDGSNIHNSPVDVKGTHTIRLELIMPRKSSLRYYNLFTKMVYK